MTAAILHTTPAALGIVGTVVSVASGLLLGVGLFSRKRDIEVTVIATYEGDSYNILKISIQAVCPSDSAAGKEFIKRFDMDDPDEKTSNKISMDLFEPLFEIYPELRVKLFALRLVYNNRPRAYITILGGEDWRRSGYSVNYPVSQTQQMQSLINELKCSVEKVEEEYYAKSQYKL